MKCMIKNKNIKNNKKANINRINKTVKLFKKTKILCLFKLK